MEIAKLFWTGRSQAVRLPKTFRAEGGEVRMRRQGAAVILAPVATDWRWLDALPRRWDSDAADAAVETLGAQERAGSTTCSADAGPARHQRREASKPADYIE